MTMIGRLATLLVLLVVSPVMAADVKTDWDHQVDFSRFKTFNWANRDRMHLSDPTMLEGLVNTINRQLEAKGLEPQDLKTDLWVVVHTSDARQVSMSTTGFGPGWGGWGVWGGVAIVTMPQYALVIDLIQRPDDKLVWRSVAGGAAPRKGVSIDVSAIVEKMFADYPPPPPTPAPTPAAAPDEAPAPEPGD